VYVNAASRPRPEARPAPVPARQRVRAAALYALRGDLRYVSHHDELRALRRALARAAWPLRYSRGFNPQPRLTLPLPRPVGCASECQWLVVDLEEARDPQALFDALARVLPQGLELLGTIVPLAGSDVLQPAQVEYTVLLDESGAALAARSATMLLDASVIEVKRPAGPARPPRRLDVRPFLESLTVEGRAVCIRLRCEGQQSARPGEILSALGLDPSQYANGVCRSAITWNLEPAGPSAGPPLRKD
jgi:radical SAM-linked protein